MRHWVEKTLAVNKLRAASRKRYWLRISDSASGIKPFDGILFLSDGRSIAVEFKVWRLKRPFDYSTVETHQMKALLEFQGQDRESWIVVYHESTEKILTFHPSKTILKKMLRGKK